MVINIKHLLQIKWWPGNVMCLDLQHVISDTWTSNLIITVINIELHSIVLCSIWFRWGACIYLSIQPFSRRIHSQPLSHIFSVCILDRLQENMSDVNTLYNSSGVVYPIWVNSTPHVNTLYNNSRWWTQIAINKFCGKKKLNELHKITSGQRL